MDITIISETDEEVRFSNGDGIYEFVSPLRCTSLIHEGTWWINLSEEYFKGGTDQFVTSWALRAHNKRDALEEYQKVTKNRIVEIKLKLKTRYELIKG